MCARFAIWIFGKGDLGVIIALQSFCLKLSEEVSLQEYQIL